MGWGQPAAGQRWLIAGSFSLSAAGMGSLPSGGGGAAGEAEGAAEGKR